MANPENRQTNPSEATKNKQNNVAEFNTQSSKTETPSKGAGATTSTPARTSGSTTGAAAATARTFYDQAKETAGQAYEAVTDKAATKLDEQKTTLSGGLATVADSVRQVSQNLGTTKTDSGLAEAAAKYTDTAARKIEDVAGYFERKNVRDMARDLEGFARQNPAVFFGAAFGLGFLVARFLKSTSPGYYPASAGREFSAARDTSHQLPPAEKTGRAPNFSAKPL